MTGIYLIFSVLYELKDFSTLFHYRLVQPCPIESNNYRCIVYDKKWDQELYILFKTHSRYLQGQIKSVVII